MKNNKSRFSFIPKQTSEQDANSNLISTCIHLLTLNDTLREQLAEPPASLLKACQTFELIQNLAGGAD